MRPEIEDCIVIGAGLSGLAAARTLQHAGLGVLVLDKGRRPGGRMASRHFEGAHFDYGAQFFSARDPEFRRLIDGFLGTALAAPWFDREGETRYCSRLGMNALPSHLAEDLRIQCGVTVVSVRRDQNLWRVTAEDGAIYSTEVLIVTAPVPQAMALLELDEQARKDLGTVEYHRCIAILAVLTGSSAIPAPGFLRIAQPPLQTLADNQQKGLASSATGVTIHATPSFSLLHWDTPQEEAAGLLLDAAAPWLGSEVTHWRYHRWRYSQPVHTFDSRFYAVEGGPPLVLAGDAFGGPRVEGAYLSGIAAANWLLER
jgi:renalase